MFSAASDLMDGLGSLAGDMMKAVGDLVAMFLDILQKAGARIISILADTLDAYIDAFLDPPRKFGRALSGHSRHIAGIAAAKEKCSGIDVVEKETEENAKKELEELEIQEIDDISDSISDDIVGEVITLLESNIPHPLRTSSPRLTPIVKDCTRTIRVSDV